MAMQSKASKRRNRKAKQEGLKIAKLQNEIHNIRATGAARKQVKRITNVSNAQGQVIPYNREVLNVLGNKMAVDYNTQFFDYLVTLAHPWTKTSALIPDWTTYPRGTAQIRTVGTITTGTTAADDTFMLTLLPCLQKSGFFVVSGGSLTTSFITINGVKYGPGQPAGTTFSVHNFLTWADVLDSYRVISMGVKVTYIGQVLNTAGRIACACLPPEAATSVTFDELADFNYSYLGPASTGCLQVYLASGMQSFDMMDVGDTISTDDRSFIQVSAKGLPLNSAVLEIEWVINIEVYSTSQVLTANKYAGKPDANKMSTATAAMSEAYHRNQLSGSSGSGRDIAKEVIRIGSKLAAPFLRGAASNVDSGFLKTLASGAATLLEDVGPLAMLAL